MTCPATSLKDNTASRQARFEALCKELAEKELDLATLDPTWPARILELRSKLALGWPDGSARGHWAD